MTTILRWAADLFDRKRWIHGFAGYAGFAEVLAGRTAGVPQGQLCSEKAVLRSTPDYKRKPQCISLGQVEKAGSRRRLPCIPLFDKYGGMACGRARETAANYCRREMRDCDDFTFPG